LITLHPASGRLVIVSPDASRLLLVGLVQQVVHYFFKVAPGVLTGIVTVLLIKQQRKAYLFSHRA
jgi:hypothetical protein